APFWFQVLDKLVKLRGAGSNPSSEGGGAPTPVGASPSGGAGPATSSTALVATSAAPAPAPEVDWKRAMEEGTAQPAAEAGNGLRAARLSALAYESDARVQMVLAGMRCTNVRLFDAQGTQAFFAVDAGGDAIVSFRGTEAKELRDFLTDADA